MGNPTIPIPISYVSGKYLLFSIDAVTYLRREHHICGVLIGTLPQIPQQNVFLGLPLELMPEEARLLVDKGVACIVDENKAHDGMKSLLEEDRRQYLRELESQGLNASRKLSDRKGQQREQVLKKLDEKAKAKAIKALENEGETDTPPTPSPSVLDEERSSSRSSNRTSGHTMAMGVTPTTSYPPLAQPTSSQHLPPPNVPLSYPLFAHLSSRGYFLSPGLRFGCQYVAYPGDPLRFHAHFLCVSAEWDEEIDLMTIVNGGRLGTGVKKGFLLGGPEKPQAEAEAERVESFLALDSRRLSLAAVKHPSGDALPCIL
ncbi:unnamed protein product [Penicillium pancosmium]